MTFKYPNPRVLNLLSDAFFTSLRPRNGVHGTRHDLLKLKRSTPDGGGRGLPLSQVTFHGLELVPDEAVPDGEFWIFKDGKVEGVIKSDEASHQSS